MGKLILQFTLLVCFEAFGFAGNTVGDMLVAYGNGNYSKARRMAERISDKPEARLVTALCLAFDPVKQDMPGGMAALKKLYLNKSLSIPVWTQAALTYGRLAQLIRERKELYGNLASGVNTHAVFQAVINKTPKSREACTALLFELTEELAGSDQMKIKSAFNRLENFCSNFEGRREYLLPLHLLADQRYISLKQDFSSAVKHLKKAYELGIANPRDAEIVLYRIGRIYDLKLNDKREAAKYYHKFLLNYPESGYAPDVRRFIENLKRRKKDNHEQK